MTVRCEFYPALFGKVNSNTKCHFTVSEAAQLIKQTMTNKIILKRAPAIASRGKQSGVFFDITQTNKVDATGVEISNDLNVIVKLDAKDPSGKHYQVTKTYNILGRGFAAFSKDFESWKSRPLTEDEIEGFDPDVLIKGRKVVCAIEHRKDGKDTVAVIKAFLPADTDEVNKN